MKSCAFVNILGSFALSAIMTCAASGDDSSQSSKPLVATNTSNTAVSNDLDKDKIIEACKAHEHAKALTLAEKLVTADPKRTDLADVLLESGNLLAQSKQFDPAASFYRMLIERFPKSKHLEHAQTELAACYYASRQLEECFEQVKVNLKLYPDSPWVEYWRFLAAQIQYRLWNYAESKTSFEEFLKDYPGGNYSEHAKAYLGRIDPPLQIDENGIVSYSGKFENDIRLKAAKEALPKHIDDGFAMLKNRLGVDLKPHANVLYSFKDVEPKTSGGLKATTRIIGMNNKPTVMIFFYAERVVTNREAFRKTTVHEIKHAGFLSIMGQSYHNLPKWIREGLALWGSEDIDQRVQVVLCNEIAGGKNPEMVLDGIDDPDHDHRDYLEDVLAFQWLASKDEGNISAFCRRLIGGEPYRKIWSDLAGASYDESMAEANEYCRRRVQAELGDGYQAFAKLRKECNAVITKDASAIQDWLDKGGIAGFEKWLADNTGHVAEPMARFSFAQALILAGRYDAGRRLLHKIIEEDRSRCTLTDDAQFWIGVSYNHQRDFVGAQRAFGVYLRDYPNSQYAKQLGKMPVAPPVTK